ncbi:acyl-CoA thioesterase [Aurantiacibacter xanthus]|jgi:4-hydroxybenzoyl-CoA thioesterase|uniref:Acyl-CoA thioesterase n=1 Tax=Aurantiacibacter xanthus TaxID=1784712 RepID=A0A3A1P301_9SPHN|nr:MULTISPECIES: acyl-CoA thioesterase [Sphingomonadales]RIV84852.1 acyl-CoA thioesterase [Aurantiacibacter xanthus]|tara:strand:- start:958 stop:1401 length:444 start_codon:yes stop_codon:yes gene_type:complete
MYVNRRRVTIEWGDCDPAGIVFYPRYFAMFDASTAHLFAAVLGMHKREMIAKFEMIGFPMVDTAARFFVPSKFGDEVTIETQATDLGRSSFGISHRVFRTGGVLAIEATEKRVWAGVHPEDPHRITGIPIPEIVRAALESGPLERQP